MLIIKPGDRVYAAVLPPPGNTRKQQIKWSGRLVVVELVNEAMIKIQEMDVKNPRTYIAHRSKLRLAKRTGQKDTDPLFKLPLLPKNEMDQLTQELGEFELPGKSNQDVIDKFCQEIHKSHMGDDGRDDSTSSSCSTSLKTKTSEDKKLRQVLVILSVPGIRRICGKYSGAGVHQTL